MSDKPTYEELEKRNKELEEALLEKKQSYEALRASEMRYYSLFDSIRDAILVADTERNIFNCNSAFCNLFGYTLDDIKGKKTLSVYAYTDEYERLGALLKNHIGDPNFLFTVHYRKKGGNIFPGETNVFYLPDNEGEVCGFIGLIRDISERIQWEESLSTALAWINMYQAGRYCILMARRTIEKRFRWPEQYCVEKSAPKSLLLEGPPKKTELYGQMPLQ